MKKVPKKLIDRFRKELDEWYDGKDAVTDACIRLEDAENKVAAITDAIRAYLGEPAQHGVVEDEDGFMAALTRTVSDGEAVDIAERVGLTVTRDGWTLTRNV
jgi:hypothetical protein